MKFLNREDELGRLLALSRRRDGSFAVVVGRRRIGKTRLLIEWVERTGGAYFVADQSAPELQMRYLARAVSAKLDGFGEGVTFTDWRGLLGELARRADAARWRGPVVIDELPYLVLQSPELPSALQQFVDHDAKRARLAVGVAGSSQRMMQGLVMDSSAPLFGRADELMTLEPLPCRWLRVALTPRRATDALDLWTAWGGVPRYWELATHLLGSATARVDALVLDPLGPLHREADHVLLEEIPTAMEVRPLLDAIGSGAHRVSEIAGRLGRPATSLSRPLERLVSMGLVRREVPFGEPTAKRGLYRIADPFFRMWFRVVAPNRGPLATMSGAGRRDMLAKHWPGLVGQAWEELCREMVPRLGGRTPLGRLGPWGPASRWWRGAEPEWDVVAESLDGKKLLFAEVKARATARDLAALAHRPLPELATGRHVVRAMFAARSDVASARDLVVVTAEHIFGFARP
jgi:AAA+ ATPase superfamily predicted ATPase